MKKLLLPTILIALFATVLGLSSCDKAKSKDKGDVMFWTNNYTTTIRVDFRDSSKNITKYYYSGTPSCGATGCANFTNVPVGTYSYYAENDDYYWDGHITVTKDNCSKMRLYIGKAVKKANPDNIDNTMLEGVETYFSFNE